MIIVKVVITTVKVVMMMNNGADDDDGDDVTGERNLLASSTWLGAKLEGSGVPGQKPGAAPNLPT